MSLKKLITILFVLIILAGAVIGINFVFKNAPQEQTLSPVLNEDLILENNKNSDNNETNDSSGSNSDNENYGKD